MKYILIFIFFFSVDIIIAQPTFQSTFILDNVSTLTQLLSSEDGGAIVVGYTNTPADDCEYYGSCNSKAFACHFNNKGVLKWSKTYSSDLAYSRIKAANTRDGGFVLFGRLYDTITRTSKGGLLIKCNSNGEIEWKKQMHTINNDLFQPQIIQEDEQGNLILISIVTYFDGGNVEVLKLDSAGNIIWSTVIGLAFFGDPFNVTSLAQEGDKYYMAGYRTCMQCEPRLETAELVTLNTEGKILSIRSIRTKNTTTGFYIDATITKLLFYNQSLYAFGYCDDKAFMFPLSDTATSINASVFESYLSNLQRYLKNKNVFPFQLDEFSLIDKNKSVKHLYKKYNQRIFLIQYDSLNRICPDYTIPTYDTSISSRLFTIEKEQQVYPGKDSVYAQHINVTSTPKLVTSKVVCTGEAPKYNDLDITSSHYTFNSNIHIYPNPANKFIHINEVKKGTSIEIFSSLGIRIKTIAAKDNNADININDLPKGIYFMRILQQNNTLYSSSFIKN